jgi:hypothetical protein
MMTWQMTTNWSLMCDKQRSKKKNKEMTYCFARLWTGEHQCTTFCVKERVSILDYKITRSESVDDDRSRMRLTARPIGSSDSLAGIRFWGRSEADDLSVRVGVSSRCRWWWRLELGFRVHAGVCGSPPLCSFASLRRGSETNPPALPRLLSTLVTERKARAAPLENGEYIFVLTFLHRGPLAFLYL